MTRTARSARTDADAAVTGVATARTRCAWCTATVITRPGTPVGTRTPAGALDLVAHVGQAHLKSVRTLPELQGGLAWECPCCDVRQVSQATDAQLVADARAASARGEWALFDPATGLS